MSVYKIFLLHVYCICVIQLLFMNRSSTLETSTSSITLSSTLQMSRSGSNLKKRKLNLSPEGGGVDFVVEDEEESSKEGDNSSQTVNNGGLIKENTKCNQTTSINNNPTL